MDSYDDILKWSEVPQDEEFKILKVDHILLKYEEEEESTILLLEDEEGDSFTCFVPKHFADKLNDFGLGDECFVRFLGSVSVLKKYVICR